MRSFEELVTIGRVVKPQGRKGELLVQPLSDREGRFAGLRRAYLPAPGGSAREVAVCSCWPHKGRVVVKLEGVDSIDAAETFRGLELRIGEEELARLPPGSYYHHQLLGLRVTDAARGELGVVERLIETGAAPVLVVRGPAGETLLPLAEDFVREVDLAAGRLRVAMPETVEC